MRMYDVIYKKREGQVLSDEEIRFAIEGITSGAIPDYQITALLMAIFLKGMDHHEIAVWTDAMAQSGDMIDLSSIQGIKVDKHSTGGVGDKTTLVVCPIVAACGVPVAKMSGRGLGYTGGTIDKLESIPGFQVSVSQKDFFQNVKEIGLSVIGQTGNIAPADKKIYALRDVTATVDNIALIASSIMSKKLASGSDAIVLDVKTGSGAFMKTVEDSIALAQEMIEIGVRNGRNVSALITDMDVPLGIAVGNNLEVKEAIDVLHSKGPKDLTEVCLLLAADMLYLAEIGTIEECLNKAKEVLFNGEALQKFRDMVKQQGGDITYIDNPGKFSTATYITSVKAEQAGYIQKMDTQKLGIASVVLGAGREVAADSIDYSAGLMILKKTGDYVEKGTILAELHSESNDKIKLVEEKILEGFTISPIESKKNPLVYARIAKDIVEYF